MFRFICVMLLCSAMDAQPISCTEDTHCSEGFYCEAQSHVCQECLSCDVLRRHAPQHQAINTCIRSVGTCGPCVEGYVNVNIYINQNDVKQKCVSLELFKIESKSYCKQIWISAASAVAVVVTLFVYVIRNTYIFQIVPHYAPISDVTPQSTGEVVVPTMMPKKDVMKQIISYFEN
ncbi:uncharacterized protein LOC142974162 [Anticarsia gemmatalis]|uniref:uncharacterized protein LOC142974162 n=1 Tax=Anticarsia gemmatalis TaxID=129554 RepID=UPI003F77254F